MRQRNLYLALAIIIAVLALGVAYAAITTQTLNVTGNITTATSDANLNVYMAINYQSIAYTFPDNEQCDLSIDPNNKKRAIMNVSGLDTKGQSRTAYFDIINDGDIYAKASNIQIDYSNTEWFDVSAAFYAGDMFGEPKPVLQDEVVIYPDDMLTGTSYRWIGVTVTLKDTPATDEEVALATDTFTITFDTDAIDNPTRENT